RVRAEPAQRALLRDGDLLELGETALLFREGEAIGDRDRTAETSLGRGLETLVPDLARSYARLAAVARSDVPILLLGESGTGKELAARAIHDVSGRTGRFVAV